VQISVLCCRAPFTVLLLRRLLLLLCLLPYFVCILERKEEKT
jgi:hypothetical protein